MKSYRGDGYMQNSRSKCFKALRHSLEVYKAVGFGKLDQECYSFLFDYEFSIAHRGNNYTYRNLAARLIRGLNAPDGIEGKIIFSIEIYLIIVSF